MFVAKLAIYRDNAVLPAFFCLLFFFLIFSTIHSDIQQMKIQLIEDFKATSKSWPVHDLMQEM